MLDIYLYTALQKTEAVGTGNGNYIPFNAEPFWLSKFLKFSNLDLINPNKLIKD